jgi:hypothetical protein
MEVPNMHTLTAAVAMVVFMIVVRFMAHLRAVTLVGLDSVRRVDCKRFGA